MDYKPSQYCNPNFQTWHLLTKADIIEYKQVVHKGLVSAINYIKIFQNAKYLSISVVNGYNKDQLMHTFLDNLQQGGKYYSCIEIQQV